MQIYYIERNLNFRNILPFFLYLNLCTIDTMGDYGLIYLLK